MIYHVFNSSVVSGPETLVLPNLQNSSMKVEIILLQETRLQTGSQKVAEYARNLGFVVHEFRVKGRLDLNLPKELNSFWKKNNASIIHTHGPKASFYTLLGLRKISNKPKLVTTHHGVRACDMQKKLKFYEWIYEKFLIPNFDFCLTVCSSDRDVLESRGISSSKLKTHLNGVDRTLISKDIKDNTSIVIRNKWNLDQGLALQKDTLIFGVVGRLAIEKQYPVLLNTVRMIIDKNNNLDFKVLCFGNGPLEFELKKLTKELNLESHVVWMGYRANVSSEMAGLDLLISLSKAEGLPINLIEAGWALTAVLATAVDGVKDLISNYQTGLLISANENPEKIADLLLESINNKSNLKNLAFEFQKNVQKSFSKSAWLIRLKEIYKELGVET